MSGIVDESSTRIRIRTRRGVCTSDCHGAHEGLDISLGEPSQRAPLRDGSRPSEQRHGNKKGLKIDSHFGGERKVSSSIGWALLMVDTASQAGHVDKVRERQLVNLIAG